MRVEIWTRPARKASAAVAAVAAGLVLAGCGGPAGSVAAGDDKVSSTLGNLLAFNSTSAPPLPGKATGPRIDCPIVQVEPGKAAFRVGGDDSASVRYQIAIGDVARECSQSNGQLLVRVGVETRTVIGPAGSPGNYAAPLTVSLRRTGDETVLASKTYQVGGAVGATGNSINTLVSDPLSAPFISERAADDYEIVLAMGAGGESRDRRRNRHRR